MLKAVIIDDEYIVIEGLKKFIDWGKFDISLVGEAYNGVEGLELIEREKPNIIITDIQMPGMSGLLVIEKAKKLLPNAVYIIFSGFNDFEYAKQAISLGVIDYLQKPVSIELLSDSLKKAIRYFKRNESNQSMLRSLKDMQQKDICHRITEFTLGENLDYESLISQLELYQSSLLLCKQLQIAAFQSTSLEHIDSFDGITSYLSNLCKEYGLDMISIKDKNKFSYVLFDQNDRQIKTIERCLLDFTNYLREEKIAVYIGISNSYAHLSSLHSAYLESMQAVKYATFQEDYTMIRFHEVEYNNSLPFQKEDQRTIIYHLRSQNTTMVLTQVKEYLDFLKICKLTPDLFCHECLELIYLATKVVEESGTQYLYTLEQDKLPHLIIGTLSSIQEVCDWVICFFTDMMQWMTCKESNTIHKSIQKVKHYIDENYEKPISLNFLAELVEMNSTYLSILFKNELNITYVKYLSKVRLEHAYLLLKEGHKVSDVSLKVGFYNSRSFREQFKREYGTLPELVKRL